MNFREELVEEIRLREFIKRAIKVKHNKIISEENNLRKTIQTILEADSDKTQHRSTGINVLEDLLKKIIPVLEQHYKMLTTDIEQRKSFSAHIVSAIENTIAPVDANKGADISLMELKLLKEIEVEIGDDSDSEELDSDAFIDIDGSTEDDTFQDLGDEDKTGLNFAQSTFDKIEKQIIDAYSLLGNEEDQDLFYKYLITNVKLYFDKFEDELKASIEEPTTDEYEKEKEEEDESGEEELEL